MTLPEIKKILNSTEFPKEFQLNPHTYIADTRIFIDSHIQTLERNSRNRTFLPHYERLVELINKNNGDSRSNQEVSV